jgi:hypothetical protein
MQITTHAELKNSSRTEIGFSLLICSGFALVRRRADDVLPGRLQDDDCEEVLIAQYGLRRTW